MKKRILILLITLLLTTGCTCEYNLTINDNSYKEEIILTGETTEEIKTFNNEWQIPVDKEDYNTMAGADSETSITGNTYKYNLSGNKLTFNHKFSKNNYDSSTAVSNCYNKLTVSSYNNSIIISTSSKVNCFDKYPPLTNIKINITVDKPVISNNADIISGNKYTWNITKENANDKSINIVLDNSDSNSEISNNDNKPDNQNKITKVINEYGIYIFVAILALIIFFGYKWFIKFKEKNNKID